MTRFCDFFFTFYYLFGKMLSLPWQICYIIGPVFIGANGQILKNNLNIWSHWSGPKGIKQSSISFMKLCQLLQKVLCYWSLNISVLIPNLFLSQSLNALHSWTVWPEDWLKSCQISTKSCPKQPKWIFTWKIYVFQNSPKSYPIFGTILKNFFSQEHFKIWSHCSWT